MNGDNQGRFLIDKLGIPYGECADCEHCKFKYADDSWHCELVENNDICRFDPD